MKLFWVLIVSIATVGRGLLAAENELPEKMESWRAMPAVRFNGGSVDTFVDLLRQAGRDAKPPLPPLNVIVPDEMRDDLVPQFELHNVTYADVFQALSSLRTPNQKKSIWRGTGNGKGPNELVWVLTSERSDDGSNAPPKETSQVFQLQRYLSKYKIEDITTAIQTTWEMLGKEKGAQLKYHKDTSLLIAVGMPEQLSVISQVLKSLAEGVVVSAELAKSQIGEVYVNGAVNKPTSLRVSPGENLDILGAIARAGGLSIRASENKIKFTRPGVMEKTFSLETLKKDPKANIPLQAGDIIEVNEKLF
jgi:hypothetical protein